MKNNLLTITLLLFALLGVAQVEDTSRTGMNLQGNVKTLLETEYEGQAIDDQRIYTVTTYQFAENGQLINIEQSAYGKPSFTHELFYDENGLLEKDVVVDFRGDKLTNTHTYENGLRKKTVSAQEGKEESAYFTIFEYDDSGQLLSETIYDWMEVISEKFEFTYDEQGRLHTRTYGDAVTTYNTSTYTYLENGDEEVDIYDNGFGMNTETLNQYDDFGNLTNNSGDMFESESTYEYDAQNNWIKKVTDTYFEGEPEEGTITIREISYYE